MLMEKRVSQKKRKFLKIDTVEFKITFTDESFAIRQETCIKKANRAYFNIMLYFNCVWLCPLSPLVLVDRGKVMSANTVADLCIHSVEGYRREIPIFTTMTHTRIHIWVHFSGIHFWSLIVSWVRYLSYSIPVFKRLPFIL